MLGKLVEGNLCLRLLGRVWKELGATAGEQTTYKKNGQKNPLPETKIQNRNLMIRKGISTSYEKEQRLMRDEVIRKSPPGIR